MMFAVGKCSLVGSGAQRDTDREILFNWLLQTFVVYRIRTPCAKVQTTQPCKTDPPVSVWSSPGAGYSALPCAQHRQDPG